MAIDPKQIRAIADKYYKGDLEKAAYHHLHGKMDDGQIPPGQPMALVRHAVRQVKNAENMNSVKQVKTVVRKVAKKKPAAKKAPAKKKRK